MGNVRLYASKMRTDAQLRALQAEVDVIKREREPELQAARDVALKANDKAAKYMLLVAELRQQLLQQGQVMVCLCLCLCLCV